MFISTEAIHEAHFVVGPVFAMSAINSGIINDLSRPETAFYGLFPLLEAEAAKFKAHGVIGVRFSFVESSLTSVIGSMIGGGKSSSVYIFAAGTAVQLHRYLQAPDQLRNDEEYRNSILNLVGAKLVEVTDEVTDEATAGLAMYQYKQIKYYLLPNGLVRYKTPQRMGRLSSFGGRQRVLRRALA